MQGIIERRLASRGVSAEVHVASNPEFLAEGRAVHDSLYPDRIVVGSDTPYPWGVMRELYSPILEQTFEAPPGTPRPERFELPPLITTTTTSAELTKYAANAFLATKISFINEFSVLAEKVGADIVEVARAIGLDSRIGGKFLNAGIGWGGSCFGKDTAAVLASGFGGPVNAASFEVGLEQVCLDLTRQLARDGEGAETLIEVRVEGARDDDQARRAAKAVVNSPLVKTAVHGADPNWGRVVMAIGKLSDDIDIDQRAVSVRFGDAEVYPKSSDEVDLAALSDYMAGDEVKITVDLGIADGCWVVYGCDLTDGYVRINADYTT